LLAKQSFNPDNIALFLLDNLPNLTLFQALLHASVAMERKLVVDWVPSCDLEDSSAREVSLLWAPNHFIPQWCFC
jgi:hypothetical protein